MTPRSVRDLVLLAPRPLRKFVRYRLLPKRMADKVGAFVDEARDSSFFRPGGRRHARTVSGSAHWLEERIWGGFSREALTRLEALKRNPLTPASEASEAARLLGIWYASKGDFARAYENAVFARVACPEEGILVKISILEADCLFALGRNEEAKLLVNAALAEHPDNTSLILTKANTLAGFDGTSHLDLEEERLSWINRIFENAELVGIRRKDPSRPLSFDNIDAPTPRCGLPIERQPLVSVLVPSFRAEETLRMAIESILKQSWQNLEVIIVDDRSPDTTFELAQTLSQEDPRVTAFCLPENSGAYVARNTALRHARGEFVTVHDADDWSHPQKIEEQVRHLIAHPSAGGNCSDWVRARPNLFFRGAARAGSGLRVILNHSSILVRRQDVLALGGWDEVRVAADSEFLRRLERAHDVDRVARVRQGVPLSFALEIATSLTRRESSHIYTLWHGVRRTYHESAGHWLNTQGAANHFALPPVSEKRAFPAPRQFLAQQAEVQYDVMFITDFAMKSEAFDVALEYVLAAISLGKKVALFQYRRFDLKITACPSPKIMELAQQDQVYIVPPGVEIEANTVIVAYPTILKFLIDSPPKIKAERLYLVASQLGSRLSSEEDVALNSDQIKYDPRQIATNATEMFGLVPTWVPVSEIVRELMMADGGYTPIHSQVWSPLINTNDWHQDTVHYRRSMRPLPVIGHHARDRSIKWGSSPEKLRDAFCADRPVDVRLLGGAKTAKKILGSLPFNWTTLRRSDVEIRSFLKDLDFYVHFPRENHTEDVNLTVFRAMALGLPVILPPNLRKNFGDAALYAEPHEVWPLIERIWNSEAEWTRSSRSSLEFVQRTCDWAQLAGRLEE